MNITSSLIGLQHMAARAQEARSLAGRTSAEPAATPESPLRPAAGGRNSPPAGHLLPERAVAAHEPDHLTGPDRAIKRLQDAALKHPQATGLQQALEMLHRNQDRRAIDTQA